MVEVPALLYQMDELLKRVDFISVGSNDLFQFLYAVDRGNSRVTDRFDTLSAPILRALRDIVKKANAAGKFLDAAAKSDVDRAMKWTTVGGVAIALAILVFGSVLVFQAFDRNSHSASDTIRPFVITMGPVWALAIAAARVLLKRPRD